MVKVVIFDYDGVIVDSFTTVYEIYKILFKELNRPIPTFEDFRKVYGYTYKECYDNVKFTPEEREMASKIFEREIVKQNPKMFDGVKEVLEFLSRKYTLGLISSNFTEEVLLKLKKFGLDSYFSFIIGQDSDDPVLKKSEKLMKVIKEHEILKEDIVYIGDRDIDYDEAMKAGVNIILVNYGWSYDKVSKPNYHVNKPKDLLKAIEMLNY